MTHHITIELERDENGVLHSVRPVPELGTTRVIAQVEAREEELDYELSDPTPEEFYAMQSLSFADWADPAEDIYTWEDGEPIEHEQKTYENKIFLAPYPFTDQSQEKLRPALCLCEPRGDLELAVFAFITLQEINDPQPTDLELDPKSEIGRSTRLLRLSTARLHRVFTINRYRVGREVGELSPELRAEVAAKLRLLFDL